MIRAICKGALRYGSSEVQKGLKSAARKKCTAPSAASGRGPIPEGFRLQIGEFWLLGGFFFQNCVLVAVGTALEPPTSRHLTLHIGRRPPAPAAAVTRRVGVGGPKVTRRSKSEVQKRAGAPYGCFLLCQWQWQCQAVAVAVTVAVAGSRSSLRLPPAPGGQGGGCPGCQEGGPKATHPGARGGRPAPRDLSGQVRS
jgi:hypothetical protein